MDRSLPDRLRTGRRAIRASRAAAATLVLAGSPRRVAPAICGGS